MLNLGVNKWQTVLSNYIWSKILVVSVQTGVGCEGLEEASVNKVFFKCSLTYISSFETDCGIIQKYFYLYRYTNEYRPVSDSVAVVPSPPTGEGAEDNLGCRMSSDPSPVGGDGSSDTGQGLFATRLHVGVLRSRLSLQSILQLISEQIKLKSSCKSLLASRHKTRKLPLCQQEERDKEERKPPVSFSKSAKFSPVPPDVWPKDSDKHSQDKCTSTPLDGDRASPTETSAATS